VRNYKLYRGILLVLVIVLLAAGYGSPAAVSIMRRLLPSRYLKNSAWLGGERTLGLMRRQPRSAKFRITWLLLATGLRNLLHLLHCLCRVAIPGPAISRGATEQLIASQRPPPDTRSAQPWFRLRPYSYAR
jgi:hypothetical protein